MSTSEDKSGFKMYCIIIVIIIIINNWFDLDKNSIDHKLSNWNIKQIHFVFINKPLTYHFY